MRKHLLTPWVLLPIVLSVIFALLFFPIVRKSHELTAALLYTAIGIFIIWGSYFVRAYIFGRIFCKQEDSLKKKQ